MDHLREGGYTTRPPLLERTNYSYWKAKMRAFIKSINKRAWRVVVTGWEHPVIINEQKEEVLKPEDQWNTEQEKIANYNSKALNAIFSAVDANQFKLIAICESANEVWKTLQTAYKGTTTVRIETIATFNAKLCDIANKAQALGEKYSDFKLMRKALRLLPKRFAYKGTTIEEARDIENMKLDELMGFLQTFELNLNHNRRDKGKNVAFQTEVPKSTSEPVDDDDISESVALLTKNFEKFLRKMNTKPYKPKPSKPSNLQKAKIIFNSSDDQKGRRIQYRECEGFGHIQVECANTLKRMSKSLTTTWSDEKSKGSQEKDKEVYLSNHVALSSKIINSHHEHVATSHRYVPTSTVTGKNDLHNSDSEIDSDEDEPSFKDIQQMYNKIFQKWLEICKINKKIQETEQELFHTQMMMKLESGKKKLNGILSNGKPCSDHHGLGYTGESSTSKTIFVKETKSIQSIFDKNNKPIFQKSKSKRFIPIYHFCNLLEHIQPRCFKFKKALRNGIHFCSPAFAMLQQTPKIKINLKNESKRTIWIRKSDLKAFVADNSLKACTTLGHVTFGDGKKDVFLKNEYLILKDCQNSRKFNKDKCQIFDETDRCILTSSRSTDNYYVLQQPQVCHNIKIDETDLWHQKLGHLNFKNLTKINHLTDQIIGSPTEGRRTKEKPKVSYQDMARFVCFTSSIEPKNVKEALLDEFWVIAIQEELEQFGRNDVWKLIPRPKHVNQLIDGMFISQSKYAKNLVKRFGLENIKPLKTPIGQMKIEPSLYRSMKGSLLYLTASRPDICFSVGVCARYQASPKESHLSAVKCIIRF
ncbi:hypothetical protein Pfo_015322 [Paulownia fortunei]|nr:hypothetical protein Pfo_015322 [Paulownia fortunei]